jgi:hypothetical protein
MTNISRIPPNDEPDYDKGFVSSGSYMYKPKREVDEDQAYEEYRMGQIEDGDENDTDD